METLYRLKNHVIGLNKEIKSVSFIKKFSSEEIYINNEKNSFELYFENINYNNKNMDILEIRYNKYGEALEIEYISLDKELIIKEVYSYLNETILEHYFVIISCKNKKLINAEIKISAIESKKNLNLIIPAKFYLKKIKAEDIFVAENTEKDMSLIILENEIYNLISFYYGENRCDMEIKTDIDKKIYLKYNLFFNKELKDGDIIGGNYLIFSENTYVENLEEIKEIYEKKDKKSFEKLEYVKGIKEIVGKEVFFDVQFSELLLKYIKNEININEFLVFLKCENALKKSIYFTSLFYVKNNLELSKKEFENYLFLGAMLSTIILKKTDDLYYEKIFLLKKSYIELDSGNIFYNYIESKKIFCFIKKIDDQISLIAFNNKPVKIKAEIVLVDKFFKNIKEGIWVLKNIENGNTEGVLKEKSFQISFDKYEKKIMKLVPFSEEVLNGVNLESSENLDSVIIKNDFYILKIRKKLEIISNILDKKTIEIDDELLEKELLENKIKLNYIKNNVVLFFNVKNKIEMEVENIFEKSFVLIKNKNIFKLLKKDSRSLYYKDEIFIKINIIEGFGEIKENEDKIIFDNIKGKIKISISMI